MKNFKIAIVSLFVVISLLFGTALTVSADGKVTYDAGSDKFIFEPGSDYSPSDLFTNFKGLMPGDSVKQNVTVKNNAEDEIKVKLYIRSKGAQEGSEDLLSQLHLTVEKAENNSMAYMFDASSDQTAGMTDWVYLGTLYSGGEVNLVLNLEVPLELGDEYQDAIGYLDWEFKAEELPKEPDDPKPPQTGDNSTVYIYGLIASVGALALVFVAYKRKRAL